MHRATKLKLTELNPHLTCKICMGYLVEACTLAECNHSFCRTCILRYVDAQHKQCPVCDIPIHKTKPLNNIKPDRTKQNLVYKLVPNLFKDEMKRRRDFYEQHPEEAKTLTGPNANELRGEVGDLPILSNDEHISLSLEYFLPVQQDITDQPGTSSEGAQPKRRLFGGGIPAEVIDRRYLRCPAAVCIVHIKKFIRYKFGLSTSYKIEVMHKEDEEEALYDHYSLMDVAYIFNWKRRKPLPLTYRVYEPTKKQKIEATKVESIVDPKPCNTTVSTLKRNQSEEPMETDEKMQDFKSNRQSHESVANRLPKAIGNEPLKDIANGTPKSFISNELPKSPETKGSMKMVNGSVPSMAMLTSNPSMKEIVNMKMANGSVPSKAMLPSNPSMKEIVNMKMANGSVPSKAMLPSNPSMKMANGNVPSKAMLASNPSMKEIVDKQVKRLPMPHGQSVILNGPSNVMIKARVITTKGPPKLVKMNGSSKVMTSNHPSSLTSRKMDTNTSSLTSRMMDSNRFETPMDVDIKPTVLPAGNALNLTTGHTKS